MKFVPVLELLDNRLQPGSMLSSGTNLSLMGLALGANLLPDLANPEAPAHVAPLARSTGLATGTISTDDTPVRGQPVLGDFSQPEFMPTNPDSQTAAQDLQAITLGQSGELARGFHHQPRTLWYNGDYDGRNGLASEKNTLVGDARVYDDFTVDHRHGWDVTHVWGNFQLSSNVSGANFEIRSGVAVGNGGTVVASGANMPATLTVHQSTGQSLIEITVDVALPEAVHLDAGTYWLTVQPVGFGNGRAFVSTTSGANSVGTPAGNNGNSFFDSTTFNFNFASTTTVLGTGTWDFSYGVGGFPTRIGGGG